MESTKGINNYLVNFFITQAKTIIASKRKRVRLVLIMFSVIFVLSVQACSYSFTGASVPAHLRTIAIPVFADKSGSGEFDLSDKLTKQLIQKFINDNTLRVGEKYNSNALLEGSIISLTDSPSVVAGGEKVTSRRVTVTVRIVYKDLVKKLTILEKNFSNYGDYAVGGDITPARKKAIELAIDKITEDILLGVVSNW